MTAVRCFTALVAATVFFVLWFSFYMLYCIKP